VVTLVAVLAPVVVVYFVYLVVTGVPAEEN